AWEEIVGRYEVTAFALDRLDEDSRHALRWRDCRKQLLDPLDCLVGRDVARSRGKRGMKHGREKRRESPALARLGGRQRQRTERAPMKGANERDVAWPVRRVARELHRAFDRLRARIREEHARRRARKDPALEALGELDLRLVVEIRARHVDEAFG